jgi:hypothetical protein
MQKKEAELEDLGATLAADKEHKIQTLSQALRSREVNNKREEKKSGLWREIQKKKIKINKEKNSGGGEWSGETRKADNRGLWRDFKKWLKKKWLRTNETK